MRGGVECRTNMKKPAKPTAPKRQRVSSLSLRSREKAGVGGRTASAITAAMASTAEAPSPAALPEPDRGDLRSASSVYSETRGRAQRGPTGLEGTQGNAAKTISPTAKPVPNSSGIRITAIETVIPDDIMPGLLLLRIHTDAGVIGHGETYYAPQAVAAMIHDWMGRRLLGADPLSIENHWRFLYERARVRLARDGAARHQRH